MKQDLDKIFESFDGNRIFKDKSILQSNHRPEEIPHREEQIRQMASILAPVLRGEREGLERRIRSVARKNQQAK